MKARGSSARQIAPATLAPKALWLLMGACHAPALWGAWGSLTGGAFSAEHLAGFFLLFASMVFFGLKVCDLPVLRLTVRRRGWVAVAIVVALLHLDVVRPSDDPTLIPECTALVASTWLLGAEPIDRALERVRGWLIQASTRKCPLAQHADSVWLDAFRPHCWTLVLGQSTPRAPPA